MEYFDFTSVMQGLLRAVSPTNLLFLGIGTTLGLFAGTLPGISGSTMLGVMLAFMFRFELDTIVIALTGIYAASVYSGSTSGILYNIPGDATGVPTTIEGYPLTRQGRAVEALAADIGGSFIGATIGFVFTIVLVPTFMNIVIFFGSGERALFAFWALIIITGGVLTKEDPLRGLISMGIGLVIGMIGIQKNVGTIRFAMWQTELWDGVHILWMILGLFAIPQLVKLSEIKTLDIKHRVLFKISFLKFYHLMIQIIIKYWKLVIRCSGIGLVIGVIPGIGAATAGWIGYGEAHRISKEREKFGKGSIEGIIGNETADNAAMPGTFVPLLALGIPGSAASAIILGAFVLAGVYPGPMMMVENAPLVWSIMFGLGLSGVFFLILGFPFIKLAQYMILMPYYYLISFIGVMTILGTYLANYSSFGVFVTILIGLFTIGATKIGISPIGLLLGYILGPIIEIEFIRAYQIGGVARFLKPVAFILVVLIVATFFWSLFLRIKRNKGQIEGTGMVRSVAVEEEIPTQVGSQNNVLCGFLGLVVAGVCFFSSRDFLFLARLWPTIVAGFLLLVPSILLIFIAIKGTTKKKWGFREKIHTQNSIFREKLFIDSTIIIGALILTTYLLEKIGFIESCVLFSFIILFYFLRSVKPAILGSLLAGLFIWAMKWSFGFVLPDGFLGV